MESRDIKRHALEAITIVASILFALWVDATWDRYQERQREAEYLAGLAIEFESAAQELASDQRVRKAVLNNLAAALNKDDDGNPPTEQAQRRASDPSNILNARFYTPSHANLDDLISSGSLQLLRSEPVRLALLNYLQERDRLAVVEQDYREYVNRHMEPYVLAHGELGQYPLGIGPNNPRPLDIAVWSDRRFVNLVWMAWARLEVVTGFADQLGRRIEQVQEALGDA